MEKIIEPNGKCNKIKIILIGESGTGKTSLINAYNGNEFNNNITDYLSSNFIKKIIKINQINYTIKIWDTAGQERFRSINKIFIKDSQIVIFVYDITNKQTFEKLNFWVNYVYQILPKTVILGLAANKKDLIENNDENYELNKDKCVIKEEGEKYADELGALFCETSAKDDPEGFIDFVRQLIYKCISERNNIEENWELIVLNNNLIKKKKKKCC